MRISTQADDIYTNDRIHVVCFPTVSFVSDSECFDCHLLVCGGYNMVAYYVKIFGSYPCLLWRFNHYFGCVGLALEDEAFANVYEPRYEKTDFLHMRKQRRRSASR